MRENEEIVNKKIITFSPCCEKNQYLGFNNPGEIIVETNGDDKPIITLEFPETYNVKDTIKLLEKAMDIMKRMDNGLI